MTVHPIVRQLQPSDEQLPPIKARGCDVAVTAGAGAGKTLTLVARYLSLLADGFEPQRIAAITFTRKAAREMRNRVRRAIADYLQLEAPDADERAMWENRYAQLDAARIGTIHSLCTTILRAHPAEADVDPRFTVLDEAGAVLLKQQAVEDALAWAANSEPHARLFAAFGERELRALLHQLMASPLEATQLHQTLPADLIAHWQRWLRRQQSLSLQRLWNGATWQSAVRCLRNNQAHDSEDRMESQRRLALAAIDGAQAAGDWEAQRAALTQLADINLSGGRQNAWPEGKTQKSAVKDALRVLRTLWREEARLQQLDLNAADAELAQLAPALFELFALALRRYRLLKNARQALDFDDLEGKALALLKSPPIARRWRDEIDAILVDEYQDTNGRQRDLINSLNGSGDCLFIVGDAKQSIYRFRGADVTVFRQERQRIAQNGRAYRLHTSYRAHHVLLEQLNTLLEPVLGVEGVAHEPWREPFSPLQPIRDVPHPDVEPPFVELHLSPGSKSDGALHCAARGLAARLISLVDGSSNGLSYGDIAILCRSSHAFAAYESALDELAIPYLTVAGRGFYERPEVRDLLNALRALSDPTDDLALVGLLRSPVWALSDAAIFRLCRQQETGRYDTLWDTIQASDWNAVQDDGEERLSKFVALVQDLNRRAGRTAVAEVLATFLRQTDYRAALRQAGQKRALRNVSKLLELAQISGVVAIDAFLEYVGAVRDATGREGEARATAENAVQIMTVHQAKGLQFAIVVLGDAGSGHVPTPKIILDPELGLLAAPKREDDEQPAILKAAQLREKSQEEAEARRLLYVAATRVRDKLILNSAVTLKKDNRCSVRGWLRELDPCLNLSSQAIECDMNGARAIDVPLEAATIAARCTVYEPHYRPSAVAVQPSPTTGETQTAWSSALIERTPTWNERWQDEEIAPLSPVSSDANGEPAPHLVGRLIHEALAVWQFPDPQGDDGFRAWIKARARQRGISQQEQVQLAVEQVCKVLLRLRRCALYDDVSRAEQCLHEVPYVLQDDRAFEQGRIDLLYRLDGQWHVVDFKTETAHDLESQVSAHRPQIRRYHRAVQQILGQAPRCFLCFLDYKGQIRNEPVPIRA
ncbi:MAG TPA: UvrD-helicase domain-containing protein [Candidatus Sulfomarinibacteraceae bacterium]|nr:UvrD-helicase domain-containing protein [Candidatus Sulfomarinibacteraceae bacterium]